MVGGGGSVNPSMAAPMYKFLINPFKNGLDYYMSWARTSLMVRWNLRYSIITFQICLGF